MMHDDDCVDDDEIDVDGYSNDDDDDDSDDDDDDNSYDDDGDDEDDDEYGDSDDDSDDDGDSDDDDDGIDSSCTFHLGGELTTTSQLQLAYHQSLHVIRCCSWCIHKSTYSHISSSYLSSNIYVV